MLALNTRKFVVYITAAISGSSYIVLSHELCDIQMANLEKLPQDIKELSD